MYSKILKSIIHYIKTIIIPLILGGYVLYLLYRDQNFSDIIHILKTETNIFILIISLLCGFIAHSIRGFRWNILIDSAKENGRETNVITSTFAVLGSYAVNMLIPRAGEVWRCWVINKKQKIGIDRLLGTLIIDRLTDVIILISMFIGVFFAYSEDFSLIINNNPQIADRLNDIIHSKYLYIGVFIMLLSFYLTIIFVRKNPEKKISKFILGLWIGIKSFKDIKAKFAFILYSLLIWIGYFLFFYLSFYAFPFTKDLDLKVGIISFVFASMSAVFPVQGGIGAWHFFVISILSMFGVLETDAKSFALIVHSSQVISVSIFGLIAIFLLTLGKQKN